MDGVCRPHVLLTGEEEEQKKKKKHCQSLDMKEMSKTFAIVEVVEGDQIQLVRC